MSDRNGAVFKPAVELGMRAPRSVAYGSSVGENLAHPGIRIRTDDCGRTSATVSTLDDAVAAFNPDHKRINGKTIIRVRP
jgi:hypothetical protein